METLNLKSIILSRQDFKENDSLVTFYTREKGKLSLVARGVKKSDSKLSGHIEPFNLANLMFIAGRQYNYIGSIKSTDNFSNIKSSLEKIETGAKIIKKIKKASKEGDNNPDIFDFYSQTFHFLDRENNFDLELFFNIFILKFCYFEGFSLELGFCVKCKKKILPGKNGVDISKGGMVCSSCLDRDNLTILNDTVKMLKLAINTDYRKILNIKINNSVKNNFINIISSFEKYYFE